MTHRGHRMFSAQERYDYKKSPGFDAGSMSFAAVRQWIRDCLAQRLRRHGRILLSLEFASPDNHPGAEGIGGPTYRFAITFADTLTGLIIEELRRLKVWQDTLFLWSVDHGLADVCEPVDIAEAERLLRRRRIPVKYSYTGARYALLYLQQPAAAGEAIEVLRGADLEWLDVVDTVANCRMNRPNGGDVALFPRSGYGFGLAKRLERPNAIHGGVSDTERRVAFFLHCPGLAPEARIDYQVMQTDFLPTALDILGIEPPASIAGSSILTGTA